MKIHFSFMLLKTGIQSFQLVCVLWIPARAEMETFYEIIFLGWQLLGRVHR